LCGDSSRTDLPDRCLDLVVTDPPFFDNVHYSELADLFFAWRPEAPTDPGVTTRSPDEVQDADAARFARKLCGVFRECARVLKDEGLLIFTYHYSRDEGRSALAEALLGAGFVVVNSQPVRAEMSVATPKTHAKEPIQLEIILVCGVLAIRRNECPNVSEAIASARAKLARLRQAGFTLSRNDRRIVLFGQLLTGVRAAQDVDRLAARVEEELNTASEESDATPTRPFQGLLFGDP
jgi:putative DNA methylase